ncbi:MAG: hypothetical protein REI94_14395 [Moraxellaceae bacterium]|nr:hypothetical protein [Moraxellaceae bacterium]
MAEYHLTREILARSTANVWNAAKLEWALHEIFESEVPETCLCGHYPIIENCVLRNKTNGTLATVGNCCVKKFIGLPSDLIFQAVKRVRTDESKSLNGEAISYAHDRGWINAWEQDFYLRIMRKRKLSDKQSAKKREINGKFLLRLRQSSARLTPQ